MAALVSVIALLFVGAVVRATGAGMGCPDWPKCWGEYIPPTDVSQIDVDTLPIEKYKEKRIRMGGDPDDITKETVLAEFNPVHTWTEFINRLCSLPVGLFSVMTMIMAYQFRRTRPVIFYGAFAAVFLVGLNAWMGMRIVHSGLQPGTITTHMALAILLMCVQVYLVWGGGEK
ncbi:MAG: cytochrome c oxidase assembly protein subunit 15, partial [Cryomorphaceae bacterium]